MPPTPRLCLRRERSPTHCVIRPIESRPSSAILKDHKSRGMQFEPLMHSYDWRPRPKVRGVSTGVQTEMTLRKDVPLGDLRALGMNVEGTSPEPTEDPPKEECLTTWEASLARPVSVVQSRATDDDWEQTMWRPHRVFHSNAFFEYDGPFNDQLCRGSGTLSLADGTVIHGQFVEGELTGKGIKHWQDGSCYRGDFLRGEQHGHGTYVTLRGESYTGDYRYGMMHGKGSYRNKKLLYTGEFMHGRFDGHGKLTEPDGTTIEGDFVRGEPCGTCVIKCPNGDQYTGRMQGGLPHGMGTFECQSTGVTYHGEMVKGARAHNPNTLVVTQQVVRWTTTDGARMSESVISTVETPTVLLTGQALDVTVKCAYRSATPLESSERAVVEHIGRRQRLHASIIATRPQSHSTVECETGRVVTVTLHRLVAGSGSSLDIAQLPCESLFVEAEGGGSSSALLAPTPVSAAAKPLPASAARTSKQSVVARSNRRSSVFSEADGISCVWGPVLTISSFSPTLMVNSMTRRVICGAAQFLVRPAQCDPGDYILRFSLDPSLSLRVGGAVVEQPDNTPLLLSLRIGGSRSAEKKFGSVTGTISPAASTKVSDGM